MLNINRHKNIFYLLFAFTIYNLFFINKAFHIDDPSTIYITESINRNLFSPQGFFSNPPFLGYYYLPVLKLFGKNEIIFHLFSLPFSWLAIISMYVLGLRFIKDEHKILPVLFLISTPAFIITSHSIMLDMPGLAFSLLAMTSFIYGVDKNDNRLLFLSAVLAGVASLIKYSGIILIPLMLLYALLFSRKRAYLFLAIPVSMFLTWIVCNMIFYGRIYIYHALIVRVKLWSFNTILTRFFASLSFISGTAIITLFFIPLFLYRKGHVFFLFLSVPIGLSPFFLKRIFADYSCIEKTFLSLLFISTLFIIFKSILLFKKPYNKDRLFLSLWFLIILIFNIFVQFVSARFILLLLPPLFLFLCNEFTAYRIYSLAGFKKMLVFGMLITFLISTILAVGDYHFAGVYRDFVNRLKKEFPSDKKIYFCPGSRSSYYSWGYAYYLNKNYSGVNSRLGQLVREEPDEIQEILFAFPKELALPIVIEKICDPATFLNRPGFNAILIKEVIYNSNVFLHNRRHRAGFYSHDWGLLPFKFCLQKTTLEKFGIYKLVSKGVIGPEP